MLTPEQWNKIEKQAIALYEQLEFEIIEEISSRIANVGYANTVVYNQAEIAQEIGILYQDIINLVAKQTEKYEAEILEIFKQAGMQSIAFDDKIYRLAGLNPISFIKSMSMIQILEATAKSTNYNLSNLTKTTASTAQTDFINAINKAYMETSTGVKSYTQSILDTIKELSTKCGKVVYPSGYRTSIENAVRMNIVTGINQMCGKMQLARAEELGWDLMELTAHSGSRPEHAVWQGKIVSLSGKSGYLSLDDIGYGEVTGFKGVNCRHDWRPYYEGSTRTYSDRELKDMNNETVTYNGKKISKYDASQIQRRMERQIRQDKKELAGLHGIIKTEKNNKTLEEYKTAFSKKSLIYKTHQNELDNFIKQTNSKKDMSRLYIGKENKKVSTQIANITKIANKYNNSNIIGTKVNGIEIKEIGEHIISRTYARNVSFESVQDTLKNTIKYGKIRADNSMQIRGLNCTVVINVKTGKLITAFPKRTKKE